MRQTSAQQFRAVPLRKSGPREWSQSEKSYSQFLTALTGRLATVPIESADDEIAEALRQVVEFFDVERSSLARLSAGGDFLVVGSYAAPGVRPMPVGDVRAQWPWYVQELLQHRAVRISGVDDVPPQAAAERAYIAASGMKSHLAVPVTVAGMPTCALGVATFSRRVEFSREFVNALLLVGEVLVGAMARREAECRLRRMEAELLHITRVTTVGQLAASIAHEINQPLCAIVNNAQAAIRLLAQPGFELELDDVRDALRDIAADGKRAGDIVSRSHHLLKPKELTFQPVSLNNVVHDMHALLRSEIVIRRVQVSLQLQEDLPEVAGDFVQLQQVVLNLFVNAADATSMVFDRTRQLDIRSCGVAGELRVLFSDNGVGLSPRVAARMFDPFFTTKPSGLGMGLAINRTIIEAHGGRIWAEPNETFGATVGFSLPLPPRRD